MFGYISHKPGIYCNVGGSCDREGYLWIIRRRLLRWLKKCDNEGKLKFVYTILIKYLKSKKQGD